MSRGASDPRTHHRLDLLAARASFWSTAWISAEYRDLAAGRPRAVGRQHCTGQDQGRDFLPISTVWLCNTAVRLQPRRGLRAASRVVVTAVAMLDPRASQFAGDCLSRVSHGRREASADLWFLRIGRTRRVLRGCRVLAFKSRCTAAEICSEALGVAADPQMCETTFRAISFSARRPRSRP